MDFANIIVNNPLKIPISMYTYIDEDFKKLTGEDLNNTRPNFLIGVMISKTK